MMLWSIGWICDEKFGWKFSIWIFQSRSGMM
jgi:hypothetical protein